MLLKIEAGWDAFVRAIAPEALNVACPELGILFALGIAYTDQRAAQNIEILVTELQASVENLELRLNAIEDGATAMKIKQIILQVVKENAQDKISFYAGIIAGELLHTKYDWDQELQTEFTNTIAHLARAELILLQALYDHRRNEAVKISPKGSVWLAPSITIDNSTLAWIDSLVKKGLIDDVSYEQIQSGFGSPGVSSVKSRSAVRLSSFARSMIEYMLDVQTKIRNKDAPESTV